MKWVRDDEKLICNVPTDWFNNKLKALQPKDINLLLLMTSSGISVHEKYYINPNSFFCLFWPRS